MWAWGCNSSGQLGDGTTTDRHTPVKVVDPGGVGYLTWGSLIAGRNCNSMAMPSDGTVWLWGDNTYGQLVDGTTTNPTSPVKITVPGRDRDRDLLPRIALHGKFALIYTCFLIDSHLSGNRAGARLLSPIRYEPGSRFVPDGD